MDSGETDRETDRRVMEEYEPALNFTKTLDGIV